MIFTQKLRRWTSWTLMKSKPEEIQHSVYATLTLNKVRFIHSSWSCSSFKIKNGSRCSRTNRAVDATSVEILKVPLNNSPTAPRCAADFSQTPHRRSEKAKSRETRGGCILTATSQKCPRRPFVHVYCSGWSTEKCWSGDAHSAPSLPFPFLLRASIVLRREEGGRLCARTQTQSGAPPYWCGTRTRPLLLQVKLL